MISKINLIRVDTIMHILPIAVFHLCVGARLYLDYCHGFVYL